MMASTKGAPIISAPEATVFLVDDDEAVRHSVSLLIRSVGLAVESYASAQEFLDHYDPEKPGCLVLDIRMPGMSGMELQKKLNASVGLLPIIFITAHGEIPLATQALRAGAVDFIQKPLSPQTLLERIQEALDLDRRNRSKRTARRRDSRADVAPHRSRARDRRFSRSRRIHQTDFRSTLH